MQAFNAHLKCLFQILQIAGYVSLSSMPVMAYDQDFAKTINHILLQEDGPSKEDQIKEYAQWAGVAMADVEDILMKNAKISTESLAHTNQSMK